MAASQCPKCGHLFEVRDGSGDPLPLAHCPSCDSYYPAHVQSCKWCGTTLVPEKARKGDSVRLKWIAAGTFAVAVLLGLLARDPSPKVASRARASEQTKPKAAMPTDTLARVTPTAPPDTANLGDTSAAATEVITDVSAPATSTPPAASPPPPRRVSSRWVSMVARRWVTVRVDAYRGAHVVASVGPNSRVQLGEARGSWRRIKLRGIAGWVDVSSGPFVAAPSSPHRPRRIADR